jgi:hypothetical protein
VVGVLRVAGPLVGDADAAGEADPAVDDEELPVRAVVEPAEVRPARRVVLLDLDAGRLQLLDQRLVHLREPTQSSSTCTLTPARARSARALGELLADRPRPVDVGLEVDRPLARRGSPSSIAGKIRSPLTRTGSGCR